jgi:uncharacterized protein YndB with AHSA1/START domain
MKYIYFVILACVLGALSMGLNDSENAQQPVGMEGPASTYNVEATEEGQLIVTETITVDAPVDRVWKAYTTSEGYAAWAAVAAEVDLQPGGTIRATYDPDGDLEGENVNTLHIVNYVPERLLTLQAEVSPNWPNVMKRDADNLYNVIIFKELGPEKTRIISYGLGYTDSPELRGMMQFFEKANQRLYQKLIDSLE